MIKSMTGYGASKTERSDIIVSVELKSVNNRFLDVNVKYPKNMMFIEELARNVVSASISRGKVDVYISADTSLADKIEISVNTPLADAYLRALNRISEDYSLPGEVSAVSLSKFPDILSLRREDVDRDLLTEIISSTLTEALTDFDAMRLREGEKLLSDLSGRLDTIDALVDRIEKRSPETVAEYRKRLTDKMLKILADSSVDEARILQEAAIYADKVAVDEETVRLKSHTSQFRHFLSSGQPVGRKLDFLVQEMNRESNTIGSKCQDVEITGYVISLKSEIEKIREQIQNVE